jgi:crotonobetainyl-CoA:carnitine CoA-transferase CaiB-like acyl-CoA transferase
VTSALAPYRVVDMTTEPGWFCGKLLADLGADVIKVEPPGGDPGRLRGPHAGGVPDPERSLRWWFQNRGKRSVVLDLATPAGRESLTALVSSADVVLESSPPGSLAQLGIGYEQLGHHRLVWTSITPFGSDGPRADWLGPDIVLAAMGGFMWLTGDPDRAPVRVSAPQYDLHASAEAACATTIALYHAAETGVGQHVDVAALTCVIRSLLATPGYPPVEDRDPVRTGNASLAGFPHIFTCRDGHIVLILGGGAGARRLLRVASEHVSVPASIAEFDWEGTNLLEFIRTEDGKRLYGHIREVLSEFFACRTKSELYEEALRKGHLMAPVNTVADVRADSQLESRGYFRAVDGVVQPGPWAKLSATPILAGARAPRVGEHTDEVVTAVRSLPAPRGSFRSSPFEGLKVLDMSWVGVGPMTARYLADYGGTVLRLESTKRPDVLRALPPFPGRKAGLNRSQFFADFNASKLGVGVDMTNPLGLQVALRLVEWADVLIESFTPKTMSAWGMGYESLRSFNPSLVMLSTCMQGQTGPRAHYRGFGQLISALSGFYEMCGWPDREPTPVGPYTDTVCQRFAATALIAALDHRARTGEGQHIDLSQYEAGLQFLGTELLDYEVNGRIAKRAGNSSPDACPHGAYPCAGDDRWVAIAVESDEQWQTLRSVMGSPGWAFDTSLENLAGRKAQEIAINDHVCAWTRERSASQVVELLQPRVPAGVVQKMSELHTDPQVVHRGYFVELDHIEIGRAPYEGLQATLSRTPGRLSKPAPCLGEDTWTVLHDMLGMSEDEISDLIAAEAVEITGGEGG